MGIYRLIDLPIYRLDFGLVSWAFPLLLPFLRLGVDVTPADNGGGCPGKCPVRRQKESQPGIWGWPLSYIKQKTAPKKTRLAKSQNFSGMSG